MSDPWELHVTILVPREEAPALDDAVDAVGARLRPWYWTGRIRQDEPPQFSGPGNPDIPGTVPL